MTHFAYILKCFNGSPRHQYIFYRGFTNDINRRYYEHKTCRCKSTKRYKGKVQLVYFEVIENRNPKVERRMAMKREKEIKKWSRAKVEKLLIVKQQKIRQLMEHYINGASV